MSRAYPSPNRHRIQWDAVGKRVVTHPTGMLSVLHIFFLINIKLKICKVFTAFQFFSKHR